MKKKAEKKYKLTKTYIAQATYDLSKNGGRDLRWDTEIPGFALRVYPSGGKSFIYCYRYSGRSRLLTIGSVEKIDIFRARKIAADYNVDVIQGKDPLREKQDKREGTSFGTFADLYIERWAKARKKTWTEDRKKIKMYFGPWVNLHLNDIKRADVADLHYKITRRSPYQANRTVKLISKMYNCALQWGYFSGENPAQGLEMNPEHKRKRWVNPQEIKALAEKITSEADIYVRAAIWLYLFTGCRKMELLKLSWADVDFERQCFTLRDTKNGEEHTIPLSPPAEAIFRRLPRLEGNPYVFPGRIPGQHRTEISKAWQRIRLKAGLKDVRIHDLRRTLGSWLVQQGRSRELIGSIFNHKSTQTTAIYTHFALENERSALDDFSTQLLEVTGKDPVLTLDYVKPGPLVNGKRSKPSRPRTPQPRPSELSAAR